MRKGEKKEKKVDKGSQTGERKREVKKGREKGERKR